MINRIFHNALALSLMLGFSNYTYAAGEATVYFPDGSSLSGELRSNDLGLNYIIIGGRPFPLDLSNLRCEGSGCPDNANSTIESEQQSKEVSSPQPTVSLPVSTEQSTAKTEQPAPRFGVYGSNTIGAELMPRLIEEYAVTQSAYTDIARGVKAEESVYTAKTSEGSPLFEIDLRAHGSGTSFPGLQSGKAEIGMASRAIKDKEVNMLKKIGIDNMRETGQEHIVALDGLIVIVSQDNPISRLNLSQVADLFSGKITNWSQIGGANQHVTVYSRDNQSGTFDTFKSLVLKPNKVKLTSSAKRFESNEELSDAVATDQGAIGFTGFAYARNAKPLSLESECGLVAEPTVFNVKTEEYPLARRLYLYTSGQALSTHAQGLLDYALSNDAQEVIADTGFIEQGTSIKTYYSNTPRLNTPPSEQPELFKRLVGELKGRDRLSTTFRFRTGSSELDVKGVQDLARIRAALLDPNSELYGREISLIGYSDSVGNFTNNQRLSKRRADSVFQLLTQGLPTSVTSKITTAGYSELMPVACNTSETGKNKNRRVEIWIN